jgi:hypothetical protein
MQANSKANSNPGADVTLGFKNDFPVTVESKSVAGVPHPEDNAAIRTTSANAHVAAIGMVVSPVTVVIAIVADSRGGPALADDDFGGSRDGSQYRRGNCGAQNKQSHL